MGVDIAIADEDVVRLEAACQGPVLLRKGRVGAGDADVMVGERGVGLGDFVARHVAGSAIVLANFAGRCSEVGLGWFVRAPAIQGTVAGEALYIVGGCRVNERLVRVVTGDARNARVSSGAPAAAHLEAIGLEADDDDSDVGGHEHGDVGPGAVACSAEVDRVRRRYGCGIGDGRGGHVVLAGGHGGDMFCAGTVAGFAGNSGNSFFWLEAIGDDGFGCVTTEAMLGGVRLEGIA